MKRFMLLVAVAFFVVMGTIIAAESMAGSCVYTTEGKFVMSTGGNYVATNHGDGSQCIPRGKAVAAAPVQKTIVETIAIHVNFDTAQSTVKPESYSELQKLAAYLNRYPDVKAEIQGHTDSMSDPQFNMTLSQNRAQAVMNLLVTKYGIDSARLSAKGFGETKPIASNDTAEGRAKNRRVEAVIMK
ncbi:MAG: OmpA family protein [Nitrospirota bacterium]